MLSRKIRIAIASLGILAIAGCSTANVTSHSTSHAAPTATATFTPIPQTTTAKTANDDSTAKAAYEAYVKAFPTSPTPDQLVALSRFTESNTAKESPALANAENKLSGMIDAFYLATKHVPTMAQIQAQAQVVNSTP
jgi:hypothetical protein